MASKDYDTFEAVQRPLDEIVEARKDVTVVIHPLADHRRTLPLERTGELLAAPPEFMLVVSYNPGYQNFLKGLKPSTRQRFVALRFGFPYEAREIRILQRETGCDALLARRLVALGNAIRRLDGATLATRVPWRRNFLTNRNRSDTGDLGGGGDATKGGSGKDLAAQFGLLLQLRLQGGGQDRAHRHRIYPDALGRQ